MLINMKKGKLAPNEMNQENREDLPNFLDKRLICKINPDLLPQCIGKCVIESEGVEPKGVEEIQF